MQAIALGSANAAWALGDWARRGVGGKRSRRSAATHYRKAAELGSSAGAFDYGRALERGSGTRKNKRAALRAYLLSAMLGDENAPYEVFRCFWHGIGSSPDRHLAGAIRDHFKQLGRFKDIAQKKTQVVILVTFGNGLVESYGVAADYHVTSVKVAPATGATLINRTLAWTGEVLNSVTDAATPANSETFTYTPSHRLATAKGEYREGPGVSFKVLLAGHD
jgi:uncharacterized protein